jgi:hypothetical protein
MAKGCKVKRVIIKRKGSKRVKASFMAHVGPGCKPRRKSHKTPAAFKPWTRAAKKCKGPVGSKKKTACMKAFVRSH